MEDERLTDQTLSPFEDTFLLIKGKEVGYEFKEKFCIQISFAQLKNKISRFFIDTNNSCSMKLFDIVIFCCE